MKKLTLTTVLALFTFASILAVPAKRTPITVTQSDGKSLTFILKGDENGHHRETIDGFWIAQDDEGNWVYLVTTKSGELINSSVLAHNPDERNEQEISFLNKLDKKDFVQKKNP